MAVNNNGLGLANPAVKPKKKQTYRINLIDSQFRRDMFRQHMTRDGYMGKFYNPERPVSVPAEKKWSTE